MTASQTIPISRTTVDSTSTSKSALIDKDDPLVYQFKLQLEHLKPPVWRRILVPNDFTFQQLHVAIQCAFGWSSVWSMNHLHQFSPAARRSDEEYLIKPIFPGDTKMKISEFFKNEKDQIRYEYDLGDTWDHILTLEKILLLDPLKIYPICTEGRTPTPPEHILPESEDSDENLNPEDHNKKKFDPKNVSFKPPDWWIQKNATKTNKHKYGYY